MAFLYSRAVVEQLVLSILGRMEASKGGCFKNQQQKMQGTAAHLKDTGHPQPETSSLP